MEQQVDLHITRSDAIHGLRTAVDERGHDYVYQAPGGESCLNWHEDTGKPGCIVGLALSLLGVPDAVLREHDRGGVYDLRQELAAHGITMYDDAALVFRVAQAAQDKLAPWGAALNAAQAVHDALYDRDPGNDV